MKNLLEEISIDVNSGETKLQQLTGKLIRLIQTQCTKGELLPSVNALSKKLNISRDTVFKAYTELKNRKIVDSTPTKGYFVNNELNKVLLLLDYYSPFKDIIYREFESKLDNSYSIDLVFHHYNKKLFESVVIESIGRYSSYIVMNFDTTQLEISDVLKKIDPAKLLLLDIPVKKWKDLDQKRYNYIWQNFDSEVYEALISIRDRIRKYKLFNIVNPKRLQHPSVTVDVFEKFCGEYKIQAKRLNSSTEINVNKGDAYFILREGDLNVLLRQCKEKNLKIGKDVGILAYNDIPLYEFVSCGITVISTDFKKMGQLASQFVLNGNETKEIIATKTLIRNSL